MIRGLLLASLVLGACSSGPSHAEPAVAGQAQSAQRVFVDRLLDTLDRQDLTAWRDLLSARMRARVGNDAAALHDQLAVWRREVLPLAPTLRNADLALETQGPRPAVAWISDRGQPETLAVVVAENGALHLDEN